MESGAFTPHSRHESLGFAACHFAPLVFGPLSGPLGAAEGSTLGVRSTRCLAARRSQYVGSQAATLPYALV
jgi:hypothetical protein